MARKRPRVVDRLSAGRGLLQLGVAGTIGVMSLAQAVHRAVLATPPLALLPSAPLINTITHAVYASAHTTALAVGQVGHRLLGGGLADGDGKSSALSAETLPTGFRSVLNGIVGDRLAAMGNPVALPMSIERPIRRPQRGIDRGRQTGRVMFIHGLCMHDRQWQVGEGVCFGQGLERHHGYRPVYLRYNTGLAIAENGRRLADLLESRQRGRGQWSDALQVVAHSMGGLVFRAALADALQRGHRWPEFLKHVVFLGTPHEGAPLERMGLSVEGLLPLSRYSAPWAALARLRSVAIRDLGYAELPALPAGEHGVRFHAVAGTIEGAFGVGLPAWVGDGLVPTSSALATGLPEHVLRIDTRTVFPGVGHVALIRHPEVESHLISLMAPGG